MALVIAEFFGVIGVDQTPPETLAELIPWIVNIYIGVVLVSLVFRVIGKLCEKIMDWRKAG